MAPRRRSSSPTSTSDFGVGRRENHDASAFYARFSPPRLSTDSHVAPLGDATDRVICGDARHMAEVPDASVALVVTSPPYFAGKEYEAELGSQGIPASYREYLELLHDVFDECVRVLEPGGRIAVNVANLGRKPYRSLAADVIAILQDRLGLLLRGEIIWQKARGAGGNCAWGSFQSAANPVLRDVTERIIVASKGRFDRAHNRSKRAAADLPHRNTITADDFMSATVDLWELAPESATRVGHPAPFPVALPKRLIELYTYEGDAVLDPFMGSGSTAVAALRTHRRFVGYDTDDSYVARANERVAEERRRLAELPVATDPVVAAVAEGRKAVEVAEVALEKAGFTISGRDTKVAPGVSVAFSATDAAGHRWLVDLCGSLTTVRSGLRRTDVLHAALGRAALGTSAPSAHGARWLVLSTDLPVAGSHGDAALRQARRGLVFDAIDLLDPHGLDRLAHYGAGTDEPHSTWLPGRADDLDRLDAVRHPLGGEP